MHDITAFVTLDWFSISILCWTYVPANTVHVIQNSCPDSHMILLKQILMWKVFYDFCVLLQCDACSASVCVLGRLRHTLFLRSPVCAKCRNVQPRDQGRGHQLAHSIAVVSWHLLFGLVLRQTQLLRDGGSHSLLLWKQNSCYTNSRFAITCSTMKSPQRFYG